MSVSTTPPPAPPKKRGLGCLGCGCLVLALLVILFLALVAGIGYLGYTKVVSLTSTTPAAVPSSEGSNDLYLATKQKLADFDHDVQNHQAATIQLSADEINILIARDPEVIKNNIHAFVTLTDDRARLQGSIPTNSFAQGFLKDRYFNFDTTFGLSFNSDTRSLDLALHHVQIGDQTTPQNLLPTLQAELTPLLNSKLQQYPAAKDFFQQTKSIGIKDGELVIETQ